VRVVVCADLLSTAFNNACHLFSSLSAIDTPLKSTLFANISPFGRFLCHLMSFGLSLFVRCHDIRQSKGDGTHAFLLILCFPDRLPRLVALNFIHIRIPATHK
jgi:hypothetical protein